MSVNIITQKLYSYLEVANDKKLQAIYAITENDINEKRFEYTVDFKKEPGSRVKSYINGEAKIVSSSESKKRIKKILRSGKK